VFHYTKLKQAMSVQSHIHKINLSNGGVPKLSVDSVTVMVSGITGDAHNDKVHHGGAERAVCLYSLEHIQALQNEGHPIEPGTAGENITTAGINFEDLEPGAVLQLGSDVVIEITSYTAPCKTIAASFTDGNFNRISQKQFPGWSRLYARVIGEGTINVNDTISILSRP
jgi:MOSC domain-containing protein YiiM